NAASPAYSASSRMIWSTSRWSTHCMTVRNAPEWPITTTGPSGRWMLARLTARRRSLSAGHWTSSSLPAGASGTMNIAFWRLALNWRAGAGPGAGRGGRRGGRAAGGRARGGGRGGFAVVGRAGLGLVRGGGLVVVPGGGRRGDVRRGARRGRVVSGRGRGCGRGVVGA